MISMNAVALNVLLVWLIDIRGNKATAAARYYAVVVSKGRAAAKLLILLEEGTGSANFFAVV